MKVELRTSPNTYAWGLYDDTRRYDFCATENAGRLERQAEIERQLRFHRLSFGRDGDDARQVVDMELIWLATLANASTKFYSSHYFFISTLTKDLVWSTSPKAWHDWDMYAECGKVVGVDFMIDAYLDGVPLEHVLSDVEFLPDREVLDPFWYTDARRAMALGA